MESRPIAPAPTRDFGQRALPIQAKLTEVPRPKDARGKEDISITTSGILNPEPARITPVVEKPTEFGFINISNPSQASSRENQRFVKSFVRHQTAKNAKAAKNTYRSQGHLELRPFDLEQVGRSVAGAVELQTPGARSGTTVPQQPPWKPKQYKPPKRKVQVSASSKGPLTSIHHSSRLDRGKPPPARGWEIISWSHRYPKATYNELMHMMGNNLFRFSRNPHNSGIVYPIEMDSESHQLVKYVHEDYDINKMRPAFRPVWFGLYLKDPASFLQFLSISVIHRGFVTGQKNDAKALAYHQKAWRSVNERLSDPAQRSCDGVLSAILAFSCLDHIVQDFERYLIDKAGLLRVVELRGGIAKLEDNAEIRLMILWDDVVGACLFDIDPSFGLPLYHLPPLPEKSPIPPSERLLHIIERGGKTYSNHQIMSLFYDFFILNSIIRTKMPGIFDDPLFLGMQINPISHRLIESSKKATTPAESTCCLAAMVYLADIRVEFLAYNVTGYHYIERLKAAVLNSEWHDLHDLRLWALVIGGIKSSEKDRYLFIDATRITMGDLGINTWNQVTEIVESIIWIDSVYGMRCQEFGREVMAGYSRLGWRGTGRKE